MSGNRLTIFDTTLRDGEQAPGFLDAHRREAQAGAAARDARRGHHRGRVSDRLRGRRRSGADRSRRRCSGPVIAALARCNPADIDRAGEALAPAPRRRIHVFIATSDLHLERKLRMTREACLDAAVAADSSRATLYRRRAVFGRGCDAQRHGLSVPGHRGSDLRRLHDGQSARHGRLLDAGRNRRHSSGTSSRACPTPARRRSARTATTISVWRSRTRWPPCAPARARSSARSTASASAPATRRSKKS